jgi:hypothetical protein
MYHAELLQGLYLARPDAHFVNRWIWLEGNVPDSEVYARNFWLDDVHDVLSADVLIAFAMEGDKLRGALVEAGIAIGAGKRVIVVGKHADYGTWQHHPAVERAHNLGHAIDLAMGLDATASAKRAWNPDWFTPHHRERSRE